MSVWFNSNFIFRDSKVKASKEHLRAFKVPIIEKTWVRSPVIFSRNSVRLRDPFILKWNMWSSVLVFKLYKVPKLYKTAYLKPIKNKIQKINYLPSTF